MVKNDDFFNYQPSFVFDIIVDNPPYNIEGTKGTGKNNESNEGSNEDRQDER